EEPPSLFRPDLSFTLRSCATGFAESTAPPDAVHATQNQGDAIARLSRVKLLPPSVASRIALVLALAALAPGAQPARAAEDAAAPPIKIGYAISRTGPFAPGAQVTQEPNYLLWADEVNAAGGLSVKGSAKGTTVKRKIELIGYDDRSEVE